MNTIIGPVIRKIRTKTADAVVKTGRRILSAAKENKKGAAAAGLIAATLLAGLTASTVFDSPAEIVTPKDVSPTPVTDVMNMTDTLETAEAAEKHKARRKSFKQAAKKKVSELPAAVRVGVVLPLYAIGAVVSKLLGAVFTTVLSPILAFLLKWLIIALIIWLGSALVLKAIFPDIPLSKLLTFKNFIYTLIGVAVIALMDKFLPLVIKDYKKWADMVKFTLGAIVIISITVPAATAIIKRRRDWKMALEL